MFDLAPMTGWSARLPSQERQQADCTMRRIMHET